MLSVDCLNLVIFVPINPLLFIAFVIFLMTLSSEHVYLFMRGRDLFMVFMAPVRRIRVAPALSLRQGGIDLITLRARADRAVVHRDGARAQVPGVLVSLLSRFTYANLHMIFITQNASLP